MMKAVLIAIIISWWNALCSFSVSIVITLITKT